MYYTGQLISLNGTWMQNVAQAWLMYRLTNSSFMLGLTAFCSLFPVLLLGLWGGVIADRHNRRRLLLTAHTLGLIQALLLGLLVISGSVQVWHILVFASMLGIIHAFEMPARHSFLSDIVSRDNLPNAIALNSSAFNLARFIGPFVAGILIAAWGEGPVFLLNALSFVAMIIALLRMGSVLTTIDKKISPVLSGIKQGLAFAWHNKDIRSSLVLLSLFSVVGTSLTVLMPVFTRNTFLGESEILGVLLGSMGVGALVGALVLAYHSSYRFLQERIGLAGMVTGACLFIFPFISSLVLAIPLLALAGFCQTMLAASTNTLIQSRVPDELRGRVMSVFSTVFIGFMPIGSISSGFIADKLGVFMTIHGWGLISCLAALVYLFQCRCFAEKHH